MNFIGIFSCRLNRPLLRGDTRSGGKAFVRLGEIGNLSALINQTTEILAVLLDDFILDLLILLRTLFGGFEPSDKRVNVPHFLAKLL